MKVLRRACIFALSLAALPLSVRADLAQTPLYDGEDGVTCRYFNVGASVPWKRSGGDWVDRDNKMHGDRPFARERVGAENRVRAVHVDLSALVGEARRNGDAQLALILREVSPRSGGTIHFYSRETQLEQVPRLVVHFAGGQTERLPAIADAQISCSTYKSLGTGEWLTVGPEFSSVIAFDLSRLPNAPIERASLSLVSRERQYGDATIGVFRLASPLQRPGKAAVAGLASQHASLRALASDPAVWFVEEFENDNWRQRWGEAGGDFELVDKRDAYGFVPTSGRALRIRIAEGRDIGGSMRLRFREVLGNEPDEAYFRYSLRFGDDWRPVPDGGKLPGFAGTYGRAGWGGRRADGSNGWSARGSFNAAPRAGNPLHAYTMVGFYAYHADMPTQHGEIWTWTDFAPALLANNRWYQIEQHVKMNTPGSANGVLRAWVDGELVFERSDLRFRNDAELRIEELWMNVYFGGTRPSARTMHLYIDNVVVANRYIGPTAMPAQ